MAGLGLINLAFLAATVAVAVPVLIHLLLRPRARRVEIGSVHFLKLVLKDSTRRRRVRRWLLLALRAAVVLLLALLFARPYLAGAGADGRDREVILLIDQSASMAATQKGRTLFAAAQDATEKVLRDLPEQTVVRLAYFDAAGVEAAADAHIDRARQPGSAATDYAQAFRWARDQLVLSPRRRREVFLLSDLQRSGLRGASEDLLPDVPVTVVEVGRPLIGNLAVVRAEAPQTLLRPGEPVVVTALIRNAGPFPARGVRIRLSLEGAARMDQTQTVTVGPASQQEVRFTPPVTKAGIYTGFVEVAGGDDFTLDDRRWLAFEARPPDRLLLVDGEPGRTVYANETYYLEAALRLRLPDKGPPLTPYEPERLAWGDAATLPDLGPYRVVVLCNVPALAAADVKRLRDFVTGGGRLLVFTGGRVQPDGYAPLTAAGMLPATIKGSSGPDLFSFASWDREHPVFRPLSDPQQGDLRRLVFHHVTRLEPAAGARVLARTQAGRPLVVEGRSGEGVVLLVGVPADRDWGDWPQGRLYVPLVHQLVGYLTERLAETRRVQTAATGPGRDNPPGVVASGRAIVVRNISPEESEIERLTVEQFRAAFHLAGPDAGARGERADAAGVALPGSQRPDELWIYLVWALLLVLMIEVFVANRTPA
jgi:hypothetical protein